MNDELKNKVDKDSDAFIEYNHKMKAIKLAYKKLTMEINKESLKAKRNFPDSKLTLLLGRKHCALFFMAMGRSLDSVDIGEIDVSGVDPFNTDVSDLELWGMSIYVSMEDDYKIEIIRNLGGINDESDLHFSDEPWIGLSRAPLIDIEGLINDLPDNMKIKRA